jgi:hypothetical protein
MRNPTLGMELGIRIVTSRHRGAKPPSGRLRAVGAWGRISLLSLKYLLSSKFVVRIYSKKGSQNIEGHGICCLNIASHAKDP